MSNFLQDIIINKLNGYYLKLYSEDKKVAAFFVQIFNNVFVSLLVFLGLIPERIRAHHA